MGRMTIPVPGGFFVFFVSVTALFLGVGTAKDLMKECSNSFSTVSPCLSFVTGKSSEPPSDCCKAVSDIRENDPVCLCYFVQVSKNGSSGQVGIQLPKLLQLSSSCHLANSSLSECPKLLNISPNSSDYSIFTDPSPSPAAARENGSSAGSSIRPQLLISFMAAAFAVCLYAFPTWIQIITK